MNEIRSRSALLALVLAVGAAGAFPRAAAAVEAAPAPEGQKTFASPQEAIAALHAAVEVHDKAALRALFGPQLRELLTGDDAQDKVNSQRFAKAIEESARPVPEGTDRVVLEIGANEWPFPIPLVRTDAGWRFDTAAGKEEIVDRHIGKDELHAIAICRAYVPAQKQRDGAPRDASGAVVYARRFKSSWRKRDGLYWKAAPGQPSSPFSERVAAADASAWRAKPFHGYFFRILTRQGPSAPGGARDYVSGGAFTGGFALVAYPERWGRSGVMTFIVDQDGTVYQRDLGEGTTKVASAMTAYDPGEGWTPVKDLGVLEK